MPLRSTLVGTVAGPEQVLVPSRWTMAYAAAVGSQLPEFFDTTRSGGVVAHPLFPVCIDSRLSLSDPNRAVMPDGELDRMVHASIDLKIHRSLKAGETVTAELEVVGAEERRSGAREFFRVNGTDQSGNPIWTTTHATIFRDVGLEGESRPLPAGDARPSVPAGSEDIPHKTWESRLEVSFGYSHIYAECSTIYHPTHTDLAVARSAGLASFNLPGTATLALAVSRIVEVSAEGISDLVRRIAVRFSGPVFPPESLLLSAEEFSTSESETLVGFSVSNDGGGSVLTDGVVQLGAP